MRGKRVLVALGVIVFVWVVVLVLMEDTQGLDQFCPGSGSDVCNAILSDVEHGVQMIRDQASHDSVLPMLYVEARPTIAHEDGVACGQGHVILGLARTVTLFGQTASVHMICREIDSNTVSVEQLSQMCEWDLSCY